MDTIGRRLVIGLVDHSAEEQLSSRILLLLMDQAKGSMTIRNLRAAYTKAFSEDLDMEKVKSQLHKTVIVSLDINIGSLPSVRT